MHKRLVCYLLDVTMCPQLVVSMHVLLRLATCHPSLLQPQWLLTLQLPKTKQEYHPHSNLLQFTTYSIPQYLENSCDFTWAVSTCLCSSCWIDWVSTEESGSFCFLSVSACTAKALSSVTVWLRTTCRESCRTDNFSTQLCHSNNARS